MKYELDFILRLDAICVVAVVLMIKVVFIGVVKVWLCLILLALGSCSLIYIKFVPSGMGV